MPTKMLQKWTKDSGKTIEEVEKIWNSCKTQAHKKFSKEDEHFWAWVNTCTRAKLGLIKHSKEEIDVLTVNRNPRTTSGVYQKTGLKGINMSYEITLSSRPKGDKKLTVYCDKVPILMVPGSVAISIGNKEKMYRAWLDKTLFGKDNKQELLNFMVRLHDKAIELGDLELVCYCKFNKFHNKVLKEFLIDNKDTLTNLISYLVPDSKNKSILEKAKEDTPQMPMMSNATLPPEEMAQIRDLIRQDIEQSKLLENVEDNETQEVTV